MTARAVPRPDRPSARRSFVWLVVLSLGSALGGLAADACSSDDLGPSGAIVGTVLDSGVTTPSTVVRLAKETAGARAVAASATEIFWVAGTGTIRAAKKQSPTEIRTVIERSGATVAALAASADELSWIEDGTAIVTLGSDGSTRTRATSPLPLDRLVVAGGTVAATGPDAGLVSVPSFAVGDGLPDDRGLAADPAAIFYTRGNGDVVRVDLDGGAAPLVVGLAAPRELVLDEAAVYTTADIDGGKALFRLDRRATGLLGDAAAPAAVLPLAPDAGNVADFLLVHDGTHVVYGNRIDGSVTRLLDAGATAITSAPGLSSLAADADGVYFTTADGVVAWAQR